MNVDAYYMDPLRKVDSIIRERKLAVQGIYTWLPQFLVGALVFCLSEITLLIVISRTAKLVVH